MERNWQVCTALFELKEVHQHWCPSILIFHCPGANGVSVIYFVRLKSIREFENSELVRQKRSKVKCSSGFSALYQRRRGSKHFFFSRLHTVSAWFADSRGWKGKEAIQKASYCRALLSAGNTLDWEICRGNACAEDREKNCTYPFYTVEQRKQDPNAARTHWMLCISKRCCLWTTD